MFSCENLSVDFEKRKVFVDGNEVHLTPIEYKTLLLLIANRGKVLTHNFIINQVWGYGGGDSKGVRVFMANLRRKIEKDTANPASSSRRWARRLPVRGRVDQLTILGLQNKCNSKE